ncbi:MAG: ABC transporter substrate-binding protein [Bacteriovorax sp.]|jgi:branched-chain amino acid transport system substrate-binding protein
MKLKLLSCLITLALSATAIAEVKVGVVLPTSGGIATFGQENINGIRLAMKKIEKTSKQKITLIVEDDKSEALEATNAIRKLLNVDKVSVVIGEVTSSNTLAMAPIAQENKVPLFSPAATNVKVTQVGNFISRACFTDDFQGVVMAKFAVNDLKKKNGLILIDNSSDYSKGLGSAFKDEFLRLGGKLVTNEELTYVQKDMDFQSLLRKVKRANPDVIFLPGYYQEVGLIIKQARALGINAPFLGGDGWDSPKLFEIGGPAIKGNYISSHFAPDDKDPKVQAFVKDYEKAYKAKPGAMAALGYDAIGIVAAAINRAKSTSPSDINEAIISTKNFAGVTGSITIDANRNSKKAAVVLETTASEFIFKNKVNP